MKPSHKLLPGPRVTRRSAPARVGVGWYTQDEWAKVKAAAVDEDRFEQTHAEWLLMAERALLNLQASGVLAQRSYVKASELLAWCLAHDKPNSAASRAEFVSEQMSKDFAAGAHRKR